MIRIAVVDDREQSMKTLLEYITGYQAYHSNYAISCFTFSGGLPLINSIFEYGKYDFYFIEIELSGEDGIRLGRRIREMDSHARIIFQADTASYALETYSVPAKDYFLRPYHAQKVWDILDRYIPEIRRQRGKMLMIRNHERGEELIPFDEIRYIERSLRGMVCHLTNGRNVDSVTLRSSFRNAISGLLDDRRFYLAGASILLNLDHIRGLRQEVVLLSDESTVIVPRRCITDLRQVWIRHWHQLTADTDDEKVSDY